MSGELEKSIWESMLSADMNVRYCYTLGERYKKYEKFYNIIISIISSGTVAAFLFANHLELVWKILGLVTPLLTIVHRYLNWTETITALSDIRRRWIEIQSEYEIIWLECDGGKNLKFLMDQYKNVKKKENEAETERYKIPIDEKLRLKCYNEVRNKREMVIRGTES